MVQIIWILLIIMLISYTFYLIRDVVKNKTKLESETSWIKTGIIGFFVNFIDALGIGAFAPQTALLKFTKQTKDKHIPGSMNAANAIAVLIESIIFIKVIDVEPITLVVMLATATFGAIIGAGIVSKLEERTIQIVMGFALFATGFIMIAGKVGWMPSGGSAIGISGMKLVIAGVVNFIL